MVVLFTGKGENPAAMEVDEPVKPSIPDKEGDNSMEVEDEEDEEEAEEAKSEKPTKSEKVLVSFKACAVIPASGNWVSLTR